MLRIGENKILIILLIGGKSNNLAYFQGIKNLTKVRLIIEEWWAGVDSNH